MRKHLKSIGIGLILLSILCCLTGCGGTQLEDIPEDTVEIFLSAVKEQDWKTVAVCIGEKESIVDDYELAFKESGTLGEDLVQVLNLIIEKSEYKNVKTTLEKKERAVVVVEVTTVDLEKTLDRVAEKIFQYMLENGETLESDPYSYSEEEVIMTLLLEELSSSDVPMETSKIEILLKKNDDEWIIQRGDKVVNDLIGGMLELGM